MKKISLYKLPVKYKSKVFGSGRWIDGPKMKRLEEKLKDYLGVKYLILTNSGTSALLAPYWALKDEYKVLYVDPYTFPATYQPAKLLGYKIRFVKQIRSKNPTLGKTGLNVITHLFGQPNPLLQKSEGFAFIEDACQAFGAVWQGKKVGTFGKIGCFSFYPTKFFHTCGHGGCVVTDNPVYFGKMKPFVESGRTEGKMTENIGLNLRMDEIKAEFLLRELGKFETRVRIQRSIAKEFLKVIPTPQLFLIEEKDSRHIYSIFNLVLKKRDQFRNFMAKRGIETAVYYNQNILPLDQRANYKELTSSVVCIPCRWNLTSKEVSYIKVALKEWFSNEENS